MMKVEEIGGMTKAIENGMPKMRIEEVAARRQVYLSTMTSFNIV